MKLSNYLHEQLSFLLISLLHRYPEFKPFYHIPEAYKTEAELLNTEEIKEPGERFIRWYADIIEHSDTKFDEKIHEKAVELNNQGVGRTQVKVIPLTKSFLF